MVTPAPLAVTPPPTKSNVVTVVESVDPSSFVVIVPPEPLLNTSHDAAVVQEARIHTKSQFCHERSVATKFPHEEFIVTLPVELLITLKLCPVVRVEVTGRTRVCESVPVNS